MRFNRILISLLALLSLLSFKNPVFAVGSSGFATQFVGAKAAGQGFAFVAEADDPSAVYFNPAGLVQLEHTQMSLGSTFLMANTKRSGADVPQDQMKRQLSVLPNLYLTGHLPFQLPSSEEKIAVGFGINSLFGMTSQWAPTSSVRYVTTTSKFETLNMNPSLAAKILPSLALGFGVDYTNLYSVDSKNEINQAAANADNSEDGKSRLTGDGDGWGYNVGLLFKPVEKHSFGASYRSKVHIGIDGQLKLSNLSASTQANYNFPGTSYAVDAKSSIVLPASFILGYAYRPSSRWTFLADYEWTQWSVFKNQDVTINESDPNRLGLLTGDPTSNTIRTQRKWEDVSAVGFGANYKMSDTLQWRGGYAYFERTVPNNTFSPDVPDSGMHLLTAGLSKSISSLVFDFAVNGWFYANRSINNTVGNAAGGSVNGTYKTFVPAVAFNIIYRT